MPKTDRFDATWRFQKLIEYLKDVLHSRAENIGLDIQRVEDIEVIGYKSRGFSKPAKVRNAKTAHFEKLDFEAPTLEAIIPLLEEIVKQLETNVKPKGSRVRAIKALLDKLAPYGSWASLAYTWLHNSGAI